MTRQGEPEPRLSKLTPVFHHLPNVDAKQLGALAQLGCTCEWVTSYHFENIQINYT